MTTLAEQVAQVKVGDWVEARFEYMEGQTITLRSHLIANRFGELFLETPTITLKVRDEKGNPTKHLTSITRVPRPIPSEPEVGSFALLDDGDVTRKMKMETERPDTWAYISQEIGLVIHDSWPEVYPLIIRLYTPSGELVTGFEYAGKETL